MLIISSSILDHDLQYFVHYDVAELVMFFFENG